VRRVATGVAGALAAVLPARYWPGIERRGIAAADTAGVSALLTLVPAAVLGVRAFLAHVGAGATAADRVVVQIATTQIRSSTGPEITSSAAQAISVASALTFLVTPAGALTMYLAASASLRLLGSYLDAPFGDPLLTCVDAGVRHVSHAMRGTYDSARQRTSFGPAVADRIVDGAAVDVPNADVVIVSSRPKENWDPGVMVVSSDGCYLIGTPLRRRIDRRDRILYPLVRKHDAAIVRRSVRYEVGERRRRYDDPRLSKASDESSPGRRP
jgi:hypothetical protein